MAVTTAKATGMSKTMSGMSSGSMRGNSLATDVEAELFLPTKDRNAGQFASARGCECEDAVVAAVLVNAK